MLLFIQIFIHIMTSPQILYNYSLIYLSNCSFFSLQVTGPVTPADQSLSMGGGTISEYGGTVSEYGGQSLSRDSVGTSL